MDKAFVDPDLLSSIQRKQTEREESFLKLKRENVLDESAREIVKLTVDQLLTKLKSREVSATQVLKAYTAKALEVTEKFNCVTEFIPQAAEWAATLDAKTDTLGPLHGLPIAIKDDHNVEGMDSTLGFAKNLYKPAKESAVLVKILIELGAVPFVKTNLPQSTFSAESDNPIFGTTLNCLNPKLSPGGSSSGSGCIVGAGGAVFATGSDIGGSVRIPSHCNGLCTVRPTNNRLSDKGMVHCVDKTVGLRSVPGIMAPDVKTLVLVWRAIIGDAIQNKYDPFAVPIPWNEKLFSNKSPLKIGYFTSLPFFPAFEDTQKTVLAAKHALEGKGHTLVPFTMPDAFHYMKLTMDVFQADHGQEVRRLFTGEPISPCVQAMVQSVRCEKGAFAYSNKDTKTEREKAVGACGEDIKTGGDLWDFVHEQQLLKQDILDRMDKAGIDLILSPTFPYPALPIGHNIGFCHSGAVAYTIIWNFVDFPAGVVPFGKESEAGWKSYDHQGEPMLKIAMEAVKESAGMPISVQFIARPFKEELVLRALQELEDCKN